MEQGHIQQLLCVFKRWNDGVKTGDMVVDVGTGSGVLSIAAALLGAKHVQALDLDEVAVRSARINVKLNKVQDRITVSQEIYLME